MHFTCKRGAAICFLIQNSDFTMFGSKCVSDLTRVDGRVNLVVYCIEDRVRQHW